MPEAFPKDAAFRPAFADPVHEAQAIFRALLAAMAEPGTLHEFPADFSPPTPLSPGAAAVALVLLDLDTQLWLDVAGDIGQAARSFLQFHTGVRCTDAPARADFALVTDGLRLPLLDVFQQGTDEEPEKGATIIVQVSALAEEPGWQLSGPGIAGERTLRVDGLRPGLPQDLAANTGRFPRGVDLVFAAGRSICALPRTTRVMEG